MTILQDGWSPIQNIFSALGILLVCGIASRSRIKMLQHAMENTVEA
jgi:hypothetical protein